MVDLKPWKTGKVQPKPKYGHLSAIHPDFAAIKEAVDKDFAALWAKPEDEFRKAWLESPEALFDDSPVEGKDITIDHVMIPMRDSSKVEIRIYKPLHPIQNAFLVYVMHGGGKKMSECLKNSGLTVS